MLKVTVNSASFNSFKPINESVSHCGNLFGIFLKMVCSILNGCCHTDNRSHIFSTGSFITLLSAAVNNICKKNTLTCIKETYTLRAMEFMSRNRQHIAIHILNINRNMTYRLNSICMKKYTFFLTNPTYLGNWLNCADFVISCHYSYKAGFICNSVCYILRFNNAV